MTTNLPEHGIAREVVDASFKIHTAMGPGLLESVYQVVLAHELIQRGLRVQREVPTPSLSACRCISTFDKSLDRGTRSFLTPPFPLRLSGFARDLFEFEDTP